MAKQPIEKGALFITTEGEYSNYEVCCLMRAIETIDVAQAWNECVKYSVSLEHWLVNVARVAEELPMQEWHKGSRWHPRPWPDDKEGYIKSCSGELIYGYKAGY